MKTKILLFVICCSYFINSNSQNFGWEWAKSAGGLFIQYGTDIKRDKTGNLYVAGSFLDTTYFDGVKLASAGSNDVFLAKYDANRNILWAKRGGGNSDDRGIEISFDNAGNCYLTGHFIGTATFDTTTVTSNSNSTDIYIAKYDANGNLIWVKTAGSKNYDYGYGIASDATGNQYVTGSYRDTIVFGNDTLTPGGIFVVKYDPNGNVLLAKSYGINTGETSTGIAVDNGQNIYLSGWISDTTTIGSTTLYPTGFNDAIIFKLDNTGNVQWVNQGKSSGGYVYANAIALDRYRNSYIVGHFEDTAYFNSDTLLNKGITADMYIAQYDVNGNFKWVEGAGGQNFEAAYSVATDTFGDIFVTGYFNSDTAFFGGAQILSAGGIDIFVANYFTYGGLKWVTKAGGAQDDIGYGICADDSGYCYTTGYFTGNGVLFDTITLNTAGGADIFFGKIKADYSLSGLLQQNNGTTPIDSGTVFLLKYNNADTAMEYLDTFNVGNGGAWLFSNLQPGAYLVYGIADSALYPTYVPTYYLRTAFWDSAFLVIAYNNLTMDIDMIEIDTSKLTGQATIKGKLLEGTYSGKIMAKGDGITSINTSVVDRTSNSIINISKTDTGGNFIFSDLQLGNYYVYVNIPGIPMDTSTYKVDITTSDTTVSLIGTADTNLIWFTVDTTNTFIGELQNERENNLLVYPNPFFNQTQIVYELKENSEVQIGLYDLLGRKIKTLPHLKQERGNYAYTMKGKMKGIFILKARLGKQEFIQKLIKIE